MSNNYEEKEPAGIVDYVVTMMYGVLAVWAVYTTFLVMGGLLGIVADGPIRLVISIVLALVLPLTTALGQNARKEEATGVEIMNRIFVGATILSFGCAIIVGITMADKVVPKMFNEPNWFMKDPHAQTGPPATNRRYSAIVADGLGRMAHAAGTYYYRPAE